MIKKVYYLSSCDTCRRIMASVGVDDSFERQDIKNEPITPKQLAGMAAVVGSYEALFSRVALKYKALGLKDQVLTEDDYRRRILEEYTFLKRPVFVLNERVFVGNAPKTIDAVKDYLLQMDS